MKLKLIVITAAIILFSGCSGIDEDKLVQLTGEKNFEQIKIAYALSVVQENEDDKSIYAYWLKENGKVADPIFSAENYIKKVEIEYK